MAGGKAVRLYPLTFATNKHLLPVFNKPVIFYAIEKMIECGIKEILIITSTDHIDNIKKTIFLGQNFIKNYNKAKISFAVQKRPDGIAQGLLIARKFIGKDNCMFYLGDNILDCDIIKYIKDFKKGAFIFLKRVKNPYNFGVAKFNKKGVIEKIIEKPKKFISKYAVIGIYIYDNTVFVKSANQPKSKKGEYEITYINNQYIKDGLMNYAIIKAPWFDVGTFESLNVANNYIIKKWKKHLRK